METCTKPFNNLGECISKQKRVCILKITPWEKLDKARLLDKSEKLLSVSAGTNGCDNLQSKQLLQEQRKQHNLESVSTDD